MLEPGIGEQVRASKESCLSSISLLGHTSNLIISCLSKIKLKLLQRPHSWIIVCAKIVPFVHGVRIEPNLRF